MNVSLSNFLSHWNILPENNNQILFASVQLNTTFSTAINNFFESNTAKP